MFNYIPECFHRPNIFRFFLKSIHIPCRYIVRCYFFAILTIVLYGSFEFCLAFNKISEFSGSGFNLGDRLAESMIEFRFPNWWDRVYAFKFGENFTSESEGSSVKEIVPLNVKRKAVGNQSHNKCATNSKKPKICGGKSKTKYFHPAMPLAPIIGFIIMLYLIFIFTQRSA